MGRRVPWGVVALLFMLVPVVEIYVIVQLGQVVGPWWTVLLLVAGGILGAVLLRREGAKAWRALKDEGAPFVVVELCEDIRIDTVQLANFEFFSGVFREFTVSVAKTYSTEPEGWTLAGTYVGKNVRGVQVRRVLVVAIVV